MKILSAAQLKTLDAYTIENEPISSVDLMERASRAIADRIIARWESTTPVKVFAGPGNNGGDALAISRMLCEAGFKVYVYLFNTAEKMSSECQTNKMRLIEYQASKQASLGARNIEFTEVTTQFVPPKLEPTDIVIDGLFGIGLSRPLNGGFASVVKYINGSSSTVISIDMPSGLMTEDNTYNVMNHVIHATVTYTIHCPKLAFFFHEHEQFVGSWEVLDIGLKDPDDESTATQFFFTEKDDVCNMVKPRSKFAHKGTMGHAVLIAGTAGMAGAAILSAKACLRSGVGKLTVRTPEANVQILQSVVPEAVLDIDVDPNCFSQSFDTHFYDAMAIGPGIGTSSYTVQAFIEQVSMSKCPMVIDADALNILGSHRGWISQLPRKSILTPHKKELFGLISSTRNSYEELESTRELAARQQIYVLIKGAYSAVVTPEGNVYFNSTGNPGMATAGSGDVLTGIILSFLAQAYTPEVALRLAVYLHGLSGDIAARELGCEESIISRDLIYYLPNAFKELKS
ncbi:MAG: NAD(P)H-hydrate dehydratase [Bacteroidaceae bacterium]|nr:NAD(P)H-hydrate dehydratase [Bacteroidaceae bacterium]